MTPMEVSVDGVSDVNDVLARFISFGGGVLTNRISSLSKFKPFLKKTNKLLNTLISLIPDEIDIPGTNGSIYIEGGISDHCHSFKNDYIIIPLDLSI